MKWKNKYNAIQTKVDGINFASKLEASVYCRLKCHANAGKISGIACQYQVNFDEQMTIMKPDFRFVFWPLGIQMFAEAKGFEGQKWKRDKKIWAKHGPAPMLIYKGTAAKPLLTEIIGPMVDDNLNRAIRQHIF